MKLGDAFSDQIKIESRFKNRVREDEPWLDFMGVEIWRREVFDEGRVGPWRFVPVYVLLLAVVLLFLSRLFSLTVVEGARNRALSDGNRIRVRVIHAPRGIIYDRNGVPLVRNVPGFRLKTVSESCRKAEAFPPPDSCYLYNVLNRDEVIALEAKGLGAGSEIETVVEREYSHSPIFSHLLGYTSEVTAGELASPVVKDRGFKGGDQMGRVGVESSFDQVLAGKDGAELIEVDAMGKTLRVIRRIDPVAGKDVHLSVDLSLQIAMYEAFSGLPKLAVNYYGGKARGAAIASSPITGEILGFLSYPTFDANLFTVNRGQEGELEKLLADKEAMPMFDRVVTGVYPPGSTFKLVVAAAGLETGKISKNTLIEDVGVIEIGRFKFPNWLFIKRGAKDGVLDVVSAIKRSNDIFFYKAGEFLGVSGINEWAQKFGVGNPLGIDIPFEEGGILPTPLWRKKLIGEEWYLGDTYHLAIGQGDLLVTPLQVNFWTNTIASGGTLYSPTVLKDKKLKSKNRNFLKEETVALVKEGMRQACDEGGTGWPLFNFQLPITKYQIDNKNYFDAGNGGISIPVACKTGTAEYGDPKNRTHAWFTVFAPIYNPTIVLTVLVEGAGEGSDVAAPLAKKMLEAWFTK